MYLLIAKLFWSSDHFALVPPISLVQMFIYYDHNTFDHKSKSTMQHILNSTLKIFLSTPSVPK